MDKYEFLVEIIDSYNEGPSDGQTDSNSSFSSKEAIATKIDEKLNQNIQTEQNQLL